MRQQMRANFQQMEQLHKQLRAQVLGALTPAHKQLLATIAGNLAISASPDLKAAVKQLDAALSPSEKSAILNADKQMREKEKSLFAQMHAKHPWPQSSGHSKRNHKPFAPSAGAILLGIASGHDGMMMHHPMGGRMRGGSPGGWGPPGNPPPSP